MILGGNIAQIPLIEAAKQEGYYVVLVDYTTTNPGIALSDKHYQVNFMDREKVLEIGRQEQVQGVISNSEPAMTVVAYVSEQLGLVGNSLNSILKVSSKIDFRNLQREIGVYVPKHMITTSFGEALQQASTLTFPIVIKPSKSSGSRGTTIVPDLGSFPDFREEWEACSRFSLDRRVVLEEFVQMAVPGNTIEAEVFVCNGKYFWEGIFTNLRLPNALSIPMTNIFPPLFGEQQIQQTKETICRIFNGAGIVFGEYNIELFYTTSGDLFCIEVNARQGGSGMPDLVRKYCGVDMYKLLITTVMGDNDYFEKILQDQLCHNFVVRYEVFSWKDGVFREIYIAPEMRPYVTGIEYFLEAGEEVSACRTAEDMVAWVDLKFDSREQQLHSLEGIGNYIYPVVE